MFFYYGSGDHRDLHVRTHSFPTRRSAVLSPSVRLKAASNPCHERARRSALSGAAAALASARIAGRSASSSGGSDWKVKVSNKGPPSCWLRRTTMRDRAPVIKYRRSEEHTSALQSLMRISYAVFCLKQKKI